MSARCDMLRRNYTNERSYNGMHKRSAYLCNNSLLVKKHILLLAFLALAALHLTVTLVVSGACGMCEVIHAKVLFASVLYIED